MQIEALIASLMLPEEIKLAILQAMAELEPIQNETRRQELERINQGIDKAHRRRNRAYMDRLADIIDEEMWKSVSASCLEEIQTLTNQQQKLNQAEESVLELAKELVELPKRLSVSWPRATDEEKTIILNSIGSNFSLKDGNIDYKLEEPLTLLTKKAQNEKWWTEVDKSRTVILLQARNIRSLSAALAA